jgi:hypothetical protein
MVSTLGALVLSLATIATSYPQPRIQNDPQSPQPVTFADFDAQIEVEKSEFEIRGGFTLGTDSNGINLFKEDVTFAVGTFARTIPAGSFKEEKRGKLSYTEVTKDLILDVTIKIAGNNKFTIKIEGEGKAVPKDVRPDQLTLKIGNDEGRARERVAPAPEN